MDTEYAEGRSGKVKESLASLPNTDRKLFGSSAWHQPVIVVCFLQLAWIHQELTDDINGHL
jgi:hypothetical protein